MQGVQGGVAVGMFNSEGGLNCAMLYVALSEGLWKPGLGECPQRKNRTTEWCVLAGKESTSS